ncbi:hypothetical protein [Ferruginibacter sp. SUN106]|uniref:hypothetical protein n=1 Tax=Ferruginibacter sp. SUN106 TaxID=2978348 RepID=UPI003D361F62
MLYNFQSLQPHNFVSILKRKVYRLLWPITLVVALQLFLPQSKLVKDNFHFYFLLVTEVLQLFSISRDSINEIVIDTVKKTLQISYYNFHQGQMKEKYAFSEIKLDISESRKSEVREINFYIKRKADFTLEKDKDNFSQQDLESLKELLYSITSPKSI